MAYAIHPGLLAIACVASALACRKDGSANPAPGAPAPLDTSALVHWVDLEPDTFVRSYRYLNNDGEGVLAVPPDSSASIWFDLDGDTMLDLCVGVSHTYQFHSPHCCNYWYGSVGGSGARILELASPPDTYLHRLRPLTAGEWIGPDEGWHEGATFRFDPPTSGAPSYGIQGDFYAGIELVSNGETHYGWVLMAGGSSAVVRAFAINLLAGHPIRAGRTQ